MRHHVTWIHWAAIIAALILLLIPRMTQGQPVIFSVETHRGNDTLYVGERAYISFDVDGQGAQIWSLVYPLLFTYGAGSLVGATPSEATIVFTSQFPGGYFPRHLAGTDPDSLDMRAIAYPVPWVTQGSEWFSRLYFQPKDTGRVKIDSVLRPPANVLAAYDMFGSAFARQWYSPGITVLPCPNVQGDVNHSGTVTSADIILFVNCVFLCDFGYFEILELGDVNCDGIATVSDVIHMVNYVFKGVPLPFCCKPLD